MNLMFSIKAGVLGADGGRGWDGSATEHRTHKCCRQLAETV